MHRYMFCQTPYLEGVAVIQKVETSHDVSSLSTALFVCGVELFPLKAPLQVMGVQLQGAQLQMRVLTWEYVHLPRSPKPVG